MIQKENCQKIGTIIKAHGAKGEVIAQFDEEIFEMLKETESIFIEIDGYLVPFFFESIRTKTTQDYFLKFEDVDHKTLSLIIEKDIYIYTNLLNITEKDFDLKSLPGFVLFDEKKMRIGEVKDYMDIPGNPNLLVSYLDSEIMIPYNEELVINLDTEKKNIIMTIPNGLLDLY